MMFEFIYSFLQEESYLIEYLFSFLSRLQPLTKDCLDWLIKRVLGALSKQTMVIKGYLIPSGLFKKKAYFLNILIRYLFQKKDLNELEMELSAVVVNFFKTYLI